LARDVARYASVDTKGLAAVPADQEVRILGIPVDVRTIKTRRGDRMAFVKLEDTHGTVECVFFSEAWGRSQKAIAAAAPVLVVGRLEGRADELKIRAGTAELLSDIRSRSTNEVHFHLGLRDLDGERLARFATLLRERRGGCRARVILRQPGAFEAELCLPDLPVDPGTELEEAAHVLFGRSDVVALS
jgi:DNA polymerase-3 subunit alpha